MYNFTIIIINEREDKPRNYSWSISEINGLGVESDLQTPRPEYLALGKTKAERLTHYRELFLTHVDTSVLEEIRTSLK